MSLARQHRDRILGQMSAAAVAPPAEGGPALPAVTASAPEAVAAAQMALRLRHDLLRLKQIQSMAKRAEVKRELLPHYTDWLRGVCAALDAGEATEVGDVLPTLMIWAIDAGELDYGFELATRVLKHRLALPARYDRTAPTLIVENLAEAALERLAAGDAAPLAILEELETLSIDEDMPDEVRAKLFKAIGLEYDRQASAIDGEGADDAALRRIQDQALAALSAAQKLHDRCGVKDRIRKIERAIAKGGSAPAAGDTQ